MRAFKTHGSSYEDRVKLFRFSNPEQNKPSMSSEVIITLTNDTDNYNDVKMNHYTLVSPDTESDITIFVFQSPQGGSNAAC